MRRYLGIDIGTTNLKICVLNSNGEIVYSASSPHDAFIHTKKGHNEQDPRKIFTELWKIFEICEEKNIFDGLSGVTVTGQMHGIVLWDSTANFWNDLGDSHSNLITWMDQRCNEDFLKSLPVWEDEDGLKESDISTGYGLATLIWFCRRSLLKECWDRCGTIMDYLIFILGIEDYVISDQLAYSWGYMTANRQWQPNILPLLPKNVKLPTIRLVEDQYSSRTNCPFFPKDIPVSLSIGDLQATLYGYVSDKTAALHLGTSAQLAYCSLNRSVPDVFKYLLRIPYFGKTSLIVAASLNGGNSIDNFIEMISTFHDQIFDSGPKQLNKSKLHKILASPKVIQPDVHIRPLFLRERHSNQGAIISDLNVDTSLEDCLVAIRQGVIDNLSRMLPVEMLKSNGIEELIMLGRAATDRVCYNMATEKFTPLKVVKCLENASAALGAAKLCIPK